MEEILFEFDFGQRHRFHRHKRQTDPLFCAVLQDDLKTLKSLVEESGRSVNSKDKDDNTLLSLAVKHKRVEIFNYLLSFDDINVDCLDRFERSPLLHLTLDFDEYFAVELIKKGANINLTDDLGFTFLHMGPRAFCDSILKVGQMVIEKGADINAQAHYGTTPLYVACEEGNFDWVSMLLYYGADPTIPSKMDILPLAAIPTRIPYDQQIQLQEILFNYTFGSDKISVTLPTLVTTMTFDSPLFSMIVENISGVTYNKTDLQYLRSYLVHLKSQHFKLFMEKFGHIVREMISEFPPLIMLLELGLELCEVSQVFELKRVLEVFLESEYVSDFVQTSDPLYSTISCLIKILNKTDMTLEKITEMVCVMLSYGLHVTSTDLNTVYNHYGYCELFRILLHMDISIVNDKAPKRFGFRTRTESFKTSAMSPLYYDLNANIESFLDITSPYSVSCLLDYYNHSKLKEICLATSSDDEVYTKAKQLPQVPLLIELSRNVARKYIVNRYNIKNSMQFYTVVKRLPIGDMNKRIISLEKKLY